MTADRPGPDPPPKGQGREAVVSAIVVQAEPPASARPGDSALVHPDGRIEGFVGGACAEASVRYHALQVLSRGEPLLLHILPPDAATPHAAQGTATARNPCLSGGALQIYLEPQLPPRRLALFGDSPIAKAVAELARLLGYEVDHHPEGAADPGQDTSWVVVATHGHFDEEALGRGLASPVPYIALVASRKRRDALLEGLALTPAERARVRCPAGLDIGARTAWEIAVSILAEMIAQRPASEPAVAPPEAQGAAFVDPVCGMTVAAADPSPSLEDSGTRVWFCGQACLERYARDHAAAAAGRDRRSGRRGIAGDRSGG